ncbi:hypothetical protein [Bacillus sp. FJAT-27245]|uniref:hypothetical protein n=1 Tax=Bacillus sp. FJAT-27245 TaxID=1684144 RepID=UPI0006A7C06F|nr:hypothetical protein [Bacillus sp. FJAT-27245]
MPEDRKETPEIKDFEVDTAFEDRIHERATFTFTINDNEYKGFYHENEIQWLHPHPQQVLDEKQLEAVEAEIHLLMRKEGISDYSGIEDLEIKAAFEDRMHERPLFTLMVDGEEYRAFVADGEIRWFHPQPHQKLEEEQVQAIESEIHKEAAKQEGQPEQKD